MACQERETGRDEACGRYSGQSSTNAGPFSGRLENSDRVLYKWVPDLRQLPSYFPPNKALVTLLTGNGWFHPCFHLIQPVERTQVFLWKYVQEF
ncbi:hypothetical protein MRX96_027995 [Rhipicephalus microplus]